MNDPRRLLEGTTGEDELALELLRAGKAEQPPAEARRRAMAAAGITSAVAVSTVAASTAAAAAAEASMPSAAAKAGTSVAGLVVKWVGIAAVGGVGLWGAWHVTAAEPSTSVAELGLAAPLSDVALPKGAGEAVVPSEDAESQASSEAADAEVVADSAPTAVGRPSGPSAAAPSTSGDLVEEVAAIDRARASMEDDPEAALAELEAYRRTFSGGVLAQEAEVLRIESLARSGRTEDAREAASAFLAEHPDSPLVSRVRAVLRAP